MKTTFYISYEMKKSNGAKQWYTSKKFDTQAEAEDLFQTKVDDARTQEAHLWKSEFWTDPTELPFEKTTNRRWDGWERANLIASYKPKMRKGIKYWNK